MGLFKYAALELMNGLGVNDKELKIQLSIKYQTLCEHTAMIGVVQLSKAAKKEGEMKTVEKINM